ncbi:hypothetical protein P8H26_07000 [Pseudochrobactrum sp. sp1633]|uniref:hypothetical protein n=1 Tax=Pseudochrobactrum sp. sp1633 TaxID=3036706 RepID=UPI0025A5B4D1|nr:hypothetical protein [Pseudochrobactrum sp. sp1633]MDM8345137.1 hypothetical protein [Pseudochrobactrum sp. sp1633]HWD13012.1 hypothetical protein [Pseudochrobactrum sp.]
MDFLLWIALIGVIVFLLGLFYSKFNSAKAKQPAARTISPAISPETTTGSQNKVTEHKSSPAPEPAKAVELVKTTHTDIQKPVPAKNIVPAQKTIPDAEPVGPAQSNIKAAFMSKPAQEIAPAVKTAETTDTDAVAVPAPAKEPERLKKPRNDQADDLTKISGIGKSIQAKLYDAGIFHYDQLANLNTDQTVWLNRIIGFAGRAERENWAGQAKKLANKVSAPAAETTKRTAKTSAKSAVKTKAKAKPGTAKKPTAAG